MTCSRKSKGSALTNSNLTSITPAPMASASTTTTTAPTHLAQSPGPVVYKGKFTRSWPQLPDELVRFVTRLPTPQTRYWLLSFHVIPDISRPFISGTPPYPAIAHKYGRRANFGNTACFMRPYATPSFSRRISCPSAHRGPKHVSLSIPSLPNNKRHITTRSCGTLLHPFQRLYYFPFLITLLILY